MHSKILGSAKITIIYEDTLIIKLEALQSLFKMAAIDALAVTETIRQRFLLAQHEPGHRETMGAADHKLKLLRSILKKKTAVAKRKEAKSYSNLQRCCVRSIFQ